MYIFIMLRLYTYKYTSTLALQEVHYYAEGTMNCMHWISQSIHYSPDPLFQQLATKTPSS